MPIALGSACELEYQIVLSWELEMLTQADFGGLEAGVVEVKRMLTSLVRRLTADRLDCKMGHAPT